jgi:LmbE family N-acetylglucosaminyl deacetylase
MQPHTILAVGAHIGDMDLAAGPILAENVLAGGRSILLALTPGERGHPSLDPVQYKHQKIDETNKLAADIGAESIIFEEQSDGFLTRDEILADNIAMLIRELKPDLMLAHWRHSMHTDHENASYIAERARFLAGLPGHREQHKPRHGVSSVYFTENWEDAPHFVPDRYVTISKTARTKWLTGISHQAFARGETYGFRYIDYYSAQMTMRGCLTGTDSAVALMSDPFPRMEQIQ